MERCRREIAAIEWEILDGHPDLQGLGLAPSDWHAELGILQNEKRCQAKAQRRDTVEIAIVQDLTE
jgi:hypothetical protein